MEAFEFPVKITNDKRLRFRINTRKEFLSNQEVNVIILVKNESEEDWNNLTLREFFEGYREKDSIYDAI